MFVYSKNVICFSKRPLGNTLPRQKVVFFSEEKLVVEWRRPAPIFC